MPSNRLEGREHIGLLSVLLILGALASPASAGPISDMLARHRAAKITRLPPVTKPLTITKIKDPYPIKSPGLTQRFKQRWALRHGGNPLTNPDPGIIKTSH